MSEAKKYYYLDKEILKERLDELIEFAYTQEPTWLNLRVNVSVDEVAKYQLSLDGNVTRKGKLNE